MKKLNLLNSTQSQYINVDILRFNLSSFNKNKAYEFYYIKKYKNWYLKCTK